MPPNWPAVAMRATSALFAVFRCGRNFTPAFAARCAMRAQLASSRGLSRMTAGVGNEERRSWEIVTLLLDGAGIAPANGLRRYHVDVNMPCAGRALDRQAFR